MRLRQDRDRYTGLALARRVAAAAREHSSGYRFPSDFSYSPMAFLSRATSVLRASARPLRAHPDILTYLRARASSSIVSIESRYYIIY